MSELKRPLTNRHGVDRSAQSLSVIIPLFNEESSIGATLPPLIEYCKTLDVESFKIITVDDGSSDDTIKNLHAIAADYAQVKILSFNRNFGKEAAINAGLQHSNADISVVMDGDGQHPKELIEQMLSLWQAGSDVVAACKSERGGESLASRLFANGFYWLFNLLTGIDVKNLSDFMLLDRAVVVQYCGLPERQRFFRGMITWMGFTTSRVYFQVPDRQDGKSSWSKLKLFRFASTAISGFSSKPLHLISVIAFIYTIGAIIIASIAIYAKITGTAVTGFSTVIILILLTGALIMFGLGLLGLYIEQIFEEQKRRPSYLINKANSKFDQKNIER
jgi:dolichol-phosphate mannosyltransferase